MKHILKYICILSVFVCFFPLLVFADSTQSYYILNNNECNSFYRQFVNSYGNTWYWTWNIAVNAQSEVRAFMIKFPNSAGSTSYTPHWGLVSLSPFTYKESHGQNRPVPACSYTVENATSNSSSASANGVTFYVAYWSGGISGSGFPAEEDSNFDFFIADRTATVANYYYYTFGEGATGPTPPVEPINWGILRDVSYSTRIAGNGSASNHNIDYISWNDLLDANGNDINECQVEIQVVPGGWTGSTEQELLSQGFEAFNGSQYNPISLSTVDASVGTYSISWQGVVNELGWNWDSLYSRLEDELWRINGWYYQVRLLAPDGYVGSWQTVYTAMSGSASGSQNVINSNTFNENLYEYITDLSIINNQQVINYTVNDTTYLINNPNYEPEHEPDENGNDYTDILRAIRIAVVNLLTGISHLPENIIGLLPDLFTFNFVEELPEDQDLETAVRDTLDETYYGDLVVALSRFKDTFNDNRNFVGSSADSGMIIIPDLGFDWAGEHITIVESQVFNLYNWVASDPDMLTAYNLYLNIVDGIIYITLFRTLFKRMLGSLDKGG